MSKNKFEENLKTVLSLVKIEDENLAQCVFGRRAIARYVNILSESIKFYAKNNEKANNNALTTIEKDLAIIGEDVAALQQYLVKSILEFEAHQSSN